MIFITALSLPFLAKKPLDLPPIISVELIQIAEKTNIPFAPKAKKIIEEVKKQEEKVTSEQAPPKKVKKEKPDVVPLPNDNLEKVKKIEEKKQNPEKIEDEIKQVSEFEKDELFDPDSIAALIDKSKEETAETTKKNNKINNGLVQNHLSKINPIIIPTATADTNSVLILKACPIFEEGSWFFFSNLFLAFSFAILRRVLN